MTSNEPLKLSAVDGSDKAQATDIPGDVSF